MTPEQWRDHLYVELHERQRGIARFQAYYDGRHPLPQAPKKIEEKFRTFAEQARTNWCQLIVDAPAERLEVVGFKFGTGDDAEAATALDVWREIWQGNHLDADSKLMHIDALTLGSSFALVWPDEAHPAGVRITMEHATQCVVAYEPGDRRRRAAGLKVWRAADGYLYSTLYLPGEVHRWTTAAKVTDAGIVPKWVPRVDSPPYVEVAGDRVLLHELRPRPRFDGVGRSELDGLTDIQDRINTTLFNRLVAGEYGAFIQRWVTGIEIEYDADGKAKNPFNLGVDQILVGEDTGARFGNFTATDLGNYVKSVEADVTHLAAISKTPPHYLLGALVNASGDALKSAETGLVSKVRDRQAFLGEDWEEIIRSALAVIDDPRSADMASEIVWRDPETRSEGELVDALVKMAGLGVPREVLWQRWGASPQDIEAWKAAAAEEAFLTALAQPAPQPPPSADAGV